MLTVSEIKLPVNHSENDLKIAAEKILKKKILSYKILKRAVDARHKDAVVFVYSLSVKIEGNESEILGKSIKNIVKTSEYRYEIPKRKSDSVKKVLVAGSGPAGLFSAFVLAKAGMNPILIERGKPVEERIADVEFFKKTGILNTDSNVQFGEGGAGTFSDGKLHTGIKDERIGFVLETFAEMAKGSADDILWMAKPHIGTDRLVRIVKNMREEIIRLGGIVKFGTQLTGINSENGKVISVDVSEKGEENEIPCDSLILAVGHSARDTFKMLKDTGIELARKPFAVGVRIEHKREMIDRSQYGKFAGSRNLGAADYKLIYRPEGLRGVYSFCMCPGGFVMPAASEENMLAVNGMSESGRDAENSNSALLVGVSPEDMDSSDVLSGIEFQRNIEKKAFETGGGGYKAPVQLVGDLISGQKSSCFGNVEPSYKPGVTPCDLHDCLPDFVIESIRHALPGFGKMIKGYDSYDAVLTGVESRSSSPVRVVRDENTLESVSLRGLFPCGEGAGYAGGIVSAAVDGIKCAEKIIAEN